MPLEITGREQEGIEILNLNGRLTFGQEDLDFRSEIDPLGKGWAASCGIEFRGSATTRHDRPPLCSGEAAEGRGISAIFNIKPAHIELLTATKL